MSAGPTPPELPPTTVDVPPPVTGAVSATGRRRARGEHAAGVDRLGRRPLALVVVERAPYLTRGEVVSAEPHIAGEDQPVPGPQNRHAQPHRSAHGCQSSVVGPPFARPAAFACMYCKYV